MRPHACKKEEGITGHVQVHVLNLEQVYYIMPRIYHSNHTDKGLFFRHFIVGLLYIFKIEQK